MAGNFECFHCLSRGVIWDSDFSFEDYGCDGDGIVHALHCTECGAEIEYRVPLGGNDDADEDGRVREGEGARVRRGHAGEDAVRGQEGKERGEVERKLVDDKEGAGDTGGVRDSGAGIERPGWWVFTFGAGHEHAGHYVRIHGTFAEARAEMVDRYDRIWAFQYSEDEWERTVSIMKVMGWPVETELKEEQDEEA